MDKEVVAKHEPSDFRARIFALFHDQCYRLKIGQASSHSGEASGREAWTHISPQYHRICIR